MGEQSTDGQEGLPASGIGVLMLCKGRQGKLTGVLSLQANSRAVHVDSKLHVDLDLEVSGPV